MRREDFIVKLDQVEMLTHSTRMNRIFSRPIKYVKGVGFRKLIFPFTKQGKEVLVNTFFNQPIHVLLPGSMDIYLFGAKTHESEIRLARFLINHAKECHVFFDVGAHAGYFSLLVNSVCSSQNISCEIFSFEPSMRNFLLLKKNLHHLSNIHLMNFAVSDTDAKIPYYQFSDLYSEYNSLMKNQYANEQWFHESDVEELEVEAWTFDTIVGKNKIIPTLIKIDVEGAESKVIQGAKDTLARFSPKVVMEILSDEKKNSGHREAHNSLMRLGYNCFFIDKIGELKSCSDPIVYMNDSSRDSDNLVYIK